MGARLTGFYAEAKQLGGLKATMRLAVATGVPSTKAGSEADSPELVKKFETALAAIKKEL